MPLDLIIQLLCSVVSCTKKQGAFSPSHVELRVAFQNTVVPTRVNQCQLSRLSQAEASAVYNCGTAAPDVKVDLRPAAPAGTRPATSGVHI